MKETKSQGMEGFSYRHLVDENISTLRELQRQYEAMAKRTWLDKVDTCNPKWVLTVEDIRI